MSISIRLSKNQDKLIVSLPIEEPRVSASGKSKLLCSTHGVKRSDASYKGHSIYVVANGFIYDQDSKPKNRRKKAV